VLEVVPELLHATAARQLAVTAATATNLTRPDPPPIIMFSPSERDSFAQTVGELEVFCGIY